jgi:putative ABC transport system substrate-binding protein
MLGIPGHAQDKSRRIHIILFGNNALLQAVAQNFKTSLSERNHSISYVQNDAGFDVSQASALARQAFSENPTAVVALGTPAIAATMAQHNGQTPLFFAATSDAFRLKLNNNNDPSKWMKFSNPPQIYGYISLFDYPKMANLATIVAYLSSKSKLRLIASIVTETESNAVLASNIWRSIFEKLKTKFIVAPVNDPSNVAAVTRSVMKKDPQLIQIGPDNMVSGAIGGVLGETIHRRIPVLASDRETVRKGATAAFGIDFGDLGHTLGRKADEVIRGRNNSPNIQGFTRQKLYINSRMANRLLGEADVLRLAKIYSKAGVAVERIP